MEQKKEILEERLSAILSYNSRRRNDIVLVLSAMKEKREESNSWCSFKMILGETIYGWEENKSEKKEFNVPYELDEKIFDLIYDFYEKQIEEIDKERDNAIKAYVEMKYGKEVLAKK